MLLEILSASGEKTEDADLVSGMLTAIRDFVRDSVGKGHGDLEEITYGDQRILIEGGQFAYIAVVLTGTEPPGYNALMSSTMQDINVHYEEALRKFSGKIENMPDFQPLLLPLLKPTPKQLRPFV